MPEDRQNHVRGHAVSRAETLPLIWDGSTPLCPCVTEALVRRHARHSGRAGTPTLARVSSCPRRGPSCSAVSLHPPWLLSRPDTPAPNRTPRRGTTGPAAHRQGSCTGGSPCCSPPEGRADTNARMLDHRPARHETPPAPPHL